MIIIVFRLARRREYDRTRHAAMTPEERETARQARRDGQDQSATSKPQTVQLKLASL